MLGLFWEGLSPWHLLLIFAVALLFYGNRLPEVARSLGRAVNEFKRGLREVQDEVTKESGEPPKPPQQLQPPGPAEKLQPPAASQTQREPVVGQPQQQAPQDDLLG